MLNLRSSFVGRPMSRYKAKPLSPEPPSPRAPPPSSIQGDGHSSDSSHSGVSISPSHQARYSELLNMNTKKAHQKITPVFQEWITRPGRTFGGKLFIGDSVSKLFFEFRETIAYAEIPKWFEYEVSGRPSRRNFKIINGYLNSSKTGGLTTIYGPRALSINTGVILSIPIDPETYVVDPAP